jgi:alpha-galactosidase
VKGHEGRDKKTGKIMPDTKKFPDGISGLSKKVHNMGLKIGIYSDAGDLTCAGYPASLGYEKIDAQTFADWEIDCELSVMLGQLMLYC